MRIRRSLAEQREWEEAAGPERARQLRDRWHEELFPLVRSLPIASLARLGGVSAAAAQAYRSGRTVPHPLVIERILSRLENHDGPGGRLQDAQGPGRR
jgi:hypothetical protein